MQYSSRGRLPHDQEANLLPPPTFHLPPVAAVAIVVAAAVAAAVAVVVAAAAAVVSAVVESTLLMTPYDVLAPEKGSLPAEFQDGEQGGVALCQP